MGRVLSQTEFNMIILGALPPSYKTVLKAVLRSAKTVGKTLTSAELIAHITEEYDEAHPDQTAESSNAALFTRSGRHDSGRRDNRKYDKSKRPPPKGNSRTKCWNCQKTGHRQADCWAKGGRKEGQGPKQRCKTANVAAETKEESTTASPPAEHAFVSAFRVSAIEKVQRNVVVDTGASKHFSPYKEQFENYRTISSVPVLTADGHSFAAIGRGDLKIKLPNGTTGTTPVTLRDCLYSPRMPATLISVICLNEANYKLFVDGDCMILSPKMRMIGRILVVNGLYQYDDAMLAKHAMIQ